VNGWWLRAVGAGRDCSLAAPIGRLCPAPQFHRYAAGPVRLLAAAYDIHAGR
jgi:hypothetical protein